MASDSESEVSFMEEEEDFVEVFSEEEDDDDFMEEENTRKGAAGKAKAKPKAKAAPKKAAAKSKGKGKAALADKSNKMDDDDDDDDDEFEIVVDDKPKSKKTKTIEETYQKKTQHEHILLRPDSYIGSTERLTEPMFVLDTNTETIVEREITFTPGLYKIYDEIVVNAADNKQRDPNMNELHIEVNPEENTISVKNNGKGIPVVMHKTEKCYVPTLIFSQLLTGSNFDDDEKKTTGGRNGFGAKLTNIFSTEFILECVDSENGLKFKQVFRDNMTVKEEPIVKSCSAAEKKKGDYTKVTFKPDLQRFKMDRLDEDAVSLLSKRAYDIAGSMANRNGKKLAVTLNGKKLPIKNFQDYLKLFAGINPPVAYEKIGDWEIGVSASMEGTPQQISFVNAICTSKGGGHVNLIEKQISAKLLETVNKKNKGGAKIKPAQVKNQLCVFVNCLVENPTFDSQTKDCLTSKPTEKKDCKVSEKFFKTICKSEIVDTILSLAKFKQNQALKRAGGVKKVKLTGIAKLDDANNAGTAQCRDCTLIITEGDSAKSLAMSGLSVVGRDYYGVFPLRGKPLNVRDATHAAIMKNEEIKNLVDILGLKFGVTYTEENIKTLRYGRLMIMADQDHDGSHIKGLTINWLHAFWPSLLDIPGFLQQFITPIVKATKGRVSKTFFTLPEVHRFLQSEESKGFSIKYYKGLGTSTSEEAKEYFANLDLHEVKFKTISEDNNLLAAPAYRNNGEGDGDGNDDNDEILPDKQTSGSDLIDMVFRKDRVEDRKAWLNDLKDDTYMDYAAARDEGVKYSDFINREFILFSRSDNMRSIPHFVDGFKPSQRKILFACFKKNLKKEIKVAQLAGYVGEKSAYHHGEASLHGTITGMAQNFCGSNNVNLLSPNGQFGTRRMGGKDAASPRYIFTKLEPITRLIFHPDDDALLTYLEDDGLSIEPEYYMPVIPLVLVNGSDGIGTGWSSTVPNHCPRQVIANLRALIKGEAPPKLHPNYYGFTGDIVQNAEKGNSYNIQGRIERVDEGTLLISELPIKKWTQDYKQFLEGMLTGDPKKDKAPELLDFRENHTDVTVSFTITADPAMIDSFEKSKGGLYGKFKLTTTLSTSNMNLFDTEGKITKYKSSEDIMSSFYDLRLEFYVKRKALLVERLGREKRILENKARFVEEVCRGDLVVSNRKRKELLSELKDRNYELFPKDPKNKGSDDAEGDEAAETEPEDADTNMATLAAGYEYLLGMKIWSLTFEKAEKLRNELKEKTKELADLEATEPTQLWLNDIDAIETGLDERDERMKENARREEAARDAAQKKGKRSRAAARKPRKKAAAPKKKNDDLADTMDTMLSVTPAKGSGKRKESPVKFDSDDEEEVKPVAAKKPAKKAVVAKKPAPGKKKMAVDSDSDSDATPVKTKKKPPAKKPEAKKKAAKTIYDDDDESEEDDFMSEEESSDEEVEMVKPPPRARAGRAAAKAAKYNVDSDSEGSEYDFDE